jgi:hypothetical protein
MRTSVVVVVFVVFLSLSNDACVSDGEQQKGIQDGSMGRSELVSKRFVLHSDKLLAWK